MKSPSSLRLSLSVLVNKRVLGQYSKQARWFLVREQIRQTVFSPDRSLLRLDPVCPDTRDAWPPLKQALRHPFPLPYHVIDNLNHSATYDLLESFFENQECFYNNATLKMPRAAVIDQIVTFTAEVTGNSFISDVRAGFSDSKTDQATRVSFKYGCLRGVYGTPFFFLNGFPLPDAGSPISYDGWRQFLDPLVHAQNMKREETLHFML